MKFLGLRIGRQGLRGKVSRVALTVSGEVSVTVRFGLDELEAAKAMMPGTLIEVIATQGPPAKKRKAEKPPKPQGELLKDAGPTQPPPPETKPEVVP